jgi:hypothetical protein
MTTMSKPVPQDVILGRDPTDLGLYSALTASLFVLEREHAEKRPYPHISFAVFLNIRGIAPIH